MPYWQMSNLCDLKTLKIIYHSLIQLHVIYGICIYGATTKHNLDKILEKQQELWLILKSLILLNIYLFNIKFSPFTVYVL